MPIAIATVMPIATDMPIAIATVMPIAITTDMLIVSDCSPANRECELGLDRRETG